MGSQAAVTGVRTESLGQVGLSKACRGFWGRQESQGGLLGRWVPGPPAGYCVLPEGMLNPSFCQVTVGRGMPEASQGSSTSSSATTWTTLGSGFTTGEAARAQGTEVPGTPLSRVSSPKGLVGSGI